jgi:hypothetical protein
MYILHDKCYVEVGLNKQGLNNKFNPEGPATLAPF